MVIPWFYIYSPKYEIFHHILCSSLQEYSGFAVEPIFYPQSAFERQVKPGEHFFAGNALKFKMILKKMDALPENSQFILSDADVYVTRPSQLYELCTMRYSEKDIVGMQDQVESEDTNIGFLLCRNNRVVRSFFEFLVHSIETTGGQDQAIYNDLVDRMVPNNGMFSLTDAIQSNMSWLKDSDYSIVQFLCSNGAYERNVFEKLLSALFYTDYSSVLHLVPYEVQEALVLFCQDHLPTHPIAIFPLTESD